MIRPFWCFTESSGGSLKITDGITIGKNWRENFHHKWNLPSRHRVHTTRHNNTLKSLAVKKSEWWVDAILFSAVTGKWVVRARHTRGTLRFSGRTLPRPPPSPSARPPTDLSNIDSNTFPTPNTKLNNANNWPMDLQQELDKPMEASLDAPE